ncbi:Hypothetical Protein FCC1311_048612 [Hondaea fermentalgiana]|uniref:Uncharacterized protein n=1 Tax=Hondaea fermentalgiana TaxID=2315210 RepID=A0A2R5GCD9_9STRA|nr:Hypothetical Protein FCC1311_048612 [Hondaea fermentalgiana]|eukprot:GBG28640.1 Hypothetical Protein FCC1311_048612 [Hondaea fermentalgiana]
MLRDAGITANRITAARTTLLLPTLYLFSTGHTVLPAALVVINVTFDYVDGAVARAEQAHKQAVALQEAASPPPPPSLLPSARAVRLEETWGAYFDAIADKAFAIPVWLCLFQHFGGHPMLQSALLAHSAVEIYSSFVRTKAYFAEPSSAKWLPAPSSPYPKNLVPAAGANAGLGRTEASKGAAAATGKAAAAASKPASAVVAGMVGKTKQFVAMLGTALVMVPLTKTLGTGLLCVSVPLAVGSVMQKIGNRVVYVEVPNEPVSAETIDFLERSKALGTRLIVGVRLTDEDHTCVSIPELARPDFDVTPALRLLAPVDAVLDPAFLPPPQSLADDTFMRNFGIHVVAVPASSTFASADSNPDHFQRGRIVPV